MNYLLLSQQIAGKSDAAALTFLNGADAERTGPIERRTIKSVLIERGKLPELVKIPAADASAARRTAYAVLVDLDYPKLDPADPKVVAVLQALQAEEVLTADDVAAVVALGYRHTARHKALGISETMVTAEQISHARKILSTREAIAEALAIRAAKVAAIEAKLAAWDSIANELTAGTAQELPNFAAELAALA